MIGNWYSLYCIYFQRITLKQFGEGVQSLCFCYVTPLAFKPHSFCYTNYLSLAEALFMQANCNRHSINVSDVTCLTLSYSYCVAHLGSNVTYKHDAPGITTVLQHWYSSLTGWGLSTLRGLDHGEGTTGDDREGAGVASPSESSPGDFNSDMK